MEHQPSLSPRGVFLRALLVALLLGVGVGVSSAVPTCNKGFLPVNGGGTGSLPPWGPGQPQPTDIWCFSPPADGLATVTVTTGGMYVTAQFFDTDGTVLYPTTQASRDVITFTYGLGPGLNPPTTYFIYVKYWSQTAGNYQISNSFAPATLDNDAEPNDGASAAVPMPLQGSKTGHLGFHDPQHHLPNDKDVLDWYRFTPSADGLLTVNVITTGMNVTAQIFDVDATPLYPPSQASHDVIAFTYGIGPGTGPPPTYYIQIKYWSGTVGSYTISTSFTAVAIPNDPEPDDTLGTAAVLTLPVSRTGHLGFHDPAHHLPQAMDVSDWYKISPQTDGVISVQVTTSGMLIHALLYRSDGTLLYPAGQTADDVISYTYPLSALTYYLKVEYFNGTAGAYSLCLGFAGAACDSTLPTPTSTPTRTVPPTTGTRTPTPTPIGPRVTGTPTPPQTPTPSGSGPITGHIWIGNQLGTEAPAGMTRKVSLLWENGDETGFFGDVQGDGSYSIDAPAGQYGIQCAYGYLDVYYDASTNPSPLVQEVRTAVAKARAGSRDIHFPAPIAFVHGILSGRGKWDDWAAWLQSNRSQQIFFTPTYGDAARYPAEAEQLNTQLSIDLETIASGIPRIHLIAHSKGGLVTRVFKAIDAGHFAADAIDDVILLGTPNDGTTCAVLDAFYLDRCVVRSEVNKYQFGETLAGRVHVVAGTTPYFFDCPLERRPFDGVVPVDSVMTIRDVNGQVLSVLPGIAVPYNHSELGSRQTRWILTDVILPYYGLGDLPGFKAFPFVHSATMHEIRTVMRRPLVLLASPAAGMSRETAVTSSREVQGRQLSI